MAFLRKREREEQDPCNNRSEGGKVSSQADRVHPREGRDVSELRTEETNKTCWPLLAQTFCLGGRLHQSLQSRQSLAKHLALLVQGDRLRHGRTNPEKLTHFIESATEARCRCEASKPTPGRGALLHATVVLLQSLGEIMITSMENVIAKDLADRTWVRTVPIRDHALWSMTDRLKGLLEKALGGVPISLLTEH